MCLSDRERLLFTGRNEKRETEIRLSLSRLVATANSLSLSVCLFDNCVRQDKQKRMKPFLVVWHPLNSFVALLDKVLLQLVSNALHSDMLLILISDCRAPYHLHSASYQSWGQMGFGSILNQIQTLRFHPKLKAIMILKRGIGGKWAGLRLLLQTINDLFTSTDTNSSYVGFDPLLDFEFRSAILSHLIVFWIKGLKQLCRVPVPREYRYGI